MSLRGSGSQVDQSNPPLAAQIKERSRLQGGNQTGSVPTKHFATAQSSYGLQPTAGKESSIFSSINTTSITAAGQNAPPPDDLVEHYSTTIGHSGVKKMFNRLTLQAQEGIAGPKPEALDSSRTTRRRLLQSNDYVTKLFPPGVAAAKQLLTPQETFQETIAGGDSFSYGGGAPATLAR